MATAGQANGAAPTGRNNTGQPHSQVRDIVRTIQKRLLLVILVVAVITLAGGIIGLTAPRHYSATATVVVYSTPPGWWWVPTRDEGAPTPPQVSVETQSKLVRTTPNAEKAVQELARGDGGPKIQATPAEILEDSTVEIVEPDILEVTISSTRKDDVVPMANALAAAYVEAAKERDRGTFTEAGKFLDTQIKRIEETIDDLNDNLLSLLEKHEVADVELETAGVQALLQQLRADRSTAEQMLQQARRSLGPLNRAMDEEPPVEELPTSEPNPNRQPLQQAVNTAQQDLARLQGRYTQEHPLVQQAQEQVRVAEQALSSAPQSVDRPVYRPNPRYDQAVVQYRQALTDVERYEGQIQALDELLREVQGRSEQLPESQVDVADIQEELAIAREAKRVLVQTRQDHQLRQASRTGIADMPNPASVAKAVTAPLIRTLIFSVLLGLFLGIALALLLEALDNTIRSPEEIARQTGLPLLGAIPQLEDPTPQVITLSAPQSPVSEAFRTLRSNISFALTDLPARSFLIASSLGGEGKSSVAANLAVVTAHAGQNVYLVDADLRKPVQANLFGCDPGKGLTNILVGDTELDDVLQETGVPGLSLLATGPLPPNPAELLDSARMTEVIDELHRRADVVIFDCPPALLLADAIILSSKIDRVVLTAESGRVTVEAFREVIRLMEHARGSLLGVVLNKYRVSTAGYYQYYYEEPPAESDDFGSPGSTDDA